jgi:GNAT superfamily N-acetyltransferase
MTSGFQIVRARTVDECRPVRALVEAHSKFERSATAVPADWAERVARFIAAGELTLFVALREGVPVGYASTAVTVETWSGAPYAHLDCLFVRDDLRGTGIGALLVAEVAEVARQDGYSELQWQTPVWNDGAIRFYQRLGAHNQTKERFTLALGAAKLVRQDGRLSTGR